MGSEKYYKWTTNNRPIYGVGEYYLDGRWQPRISDRLNECKQGYHICSESQLPYWRGTELWEIEIDATDMIVCDFKNICRSWRIVKQLVWSKRDMTDCATTDATVASAAASAAAGAVVGDHYFSLYSARYASDAAIRATYAASDLRRWLKHGDFVPIVATLVAVAIAIDAISAARDAAIVCYSTSAAVTAAGVSERNRQKEWILDRASG
jgi:hypothetical protein